MRFRRCREYQQVLEHVTPYQGHAYLNYLKEQGVSIKELKRMTKDIHLFNKVGKPNLYLFPGIGRISPTLLRYATVNHNLGKLFGKLDNLRICEIGAGFGGQVMISGHFYEFSEWAIYDLPPVLDLQKRFFKEVNFPLDKIRFFSGIEPIHIQSGDLLISNYAFSELSRDYQMSYIKSVLRNFPMGYITWNTLAQRELGGITIEEFATEIPYLRILAEIPLTASGNKIIYWDVR
jgi:hypothetical protein